MKKGAVAGAVVWSAPILMSSPAFAATGKCSGSKPCVNFHYFKLDSGNAIVCNGTSDGSGCAEFDGADLACPGTPEDELPSVTGSCVGIDLDNTTTDYSTTATFSFKEDVVPLIVQIKHGSGCTSLRYVEDPEGDGPGTFVTVIPGPGTCTVSVTSISGTVSDGGITVTFTKSGTAPMGGCGGISHMGAYYCI